MSDGMGREEGARKVVGIVFAHGTMAEGMVDAVRGIAGTEGDALVPLSNRGLGPEALQAEVERIAGTDPAVVFTDLRSGSCAMAAQLTCKGKGGRAVLCGVNLPMLLDFVFHREMPLDELVDRLVGKGREAVQCLTPAREDGGTSG